MSEKIHLSSDGFYVFHCPGCEGGHMVAVNGNHLENGAGWSWNGSLTMPTFNPSILVRSEVFSAKGQADYESWSRGEIPCPDKFDTTNGVCHSFVKDGKIMFLTDCTHKLAGQTIELPDWDD